MTDPVGTPLQVTIHPLPEKLAAGAFWSAEAPTFADFLDIINPLQHLPIVSSLYQAVTGDVQVPAAKIFGGALFGGPIGLLAAIFDTIMEQETGANLSENLVAAVTGEEIPAFEVASSDPLDGLTLHQRKSYNAYVHAQSLLA